MDNNYKELMLCSVDKLINNYTTQGYGRGRIIMLISIINKILLDIDYMLNDSVKTKLNNLITILGNSDKDLCIYDLTPNYIYEDGCMNPTYESDKSTFNNKPRVSDTTIVL